MKPGTANITASARSTGKANRRWGAGMIPSARVPLLATQAGLDVYDVRLNDRAMHVFPPYRHEKQQNYLELSKIYHAPAPDDRWFNLTLETILAGGGTEADARWYYAATDSATILQAIEAGTFTATGSFALYLTFARKP